MGGCRTMLNRLFSIEFERGELEKSRGVLGDEH